MKYTSIDSGLFINDNSLEALKDFADKSIDCVLTDPPYFIDGMGADWSNDNLRAKKSKANVVGSLPVGMKFDPQQGKDLQEFMFQISKEIYRILKPGGFYLSFSQGRLYHRMAVAIEDAGFEVRDMLIWKREGQAKAFSQDHFVRKMKISEQQKQDILASLNGRKTPQLKGQSEPIVLAQKPKEGTFVQNWITYGVGLIDTTQSLDDKFPGTVIEVHKPKGEERKESNHLTLKPITLLEHLINVFTKENDVILDPFCGSGSCGIACQRTGRRFIGIELSEEFYNESIQRYEKHMNEQKIDDNGNKISTDIKVSDFINKI